MSTARSEKCPLWLHVCAVATRGTPPKRYNLGKNRTGDHVPLITKGCECVCPTLCVYVKCLYNMSMCISFNIKLLSHNKNKVKSRKEEKAMCSKPNSHRTKQTNKPAEPYQGRERSSKQSELHVQKQRVELSSSFLVFIQPPRNLRRTLTRRNV